MYIYIDQILDKRQLPFLTTITQKQVATKQTIKCLNVYITIENKSSCNTFSNILNIFQKN